MVIEPVEMTLNTTDSGFDKFNHRHFYLLDIPFKYNAGRKQKFALPLKFQIRVTKEEKDFISYAREHHLNYSDLMQM